MYDEKCPANVSVWSCCFQDSIDLFLGNFAVDESDGPTPLRVQKDWKFLTVSTPDVCYQVAVSKCDCQSDSFKSCFF